MSKMMKINLYGEVPCGTFTEKTEHVAFGAALGLTDGNHGPFNEDKTVTYPVVFANAGGAYNPQTGVFTAPVKGVYFFTFSGHSLTSKAMGLQLMKNGEPVVMIYNHIDEPGRYIAASNAMNLELEKGDSVYVKLLKNTWMVDNNNNHSTFVGQLLFEDHTQR
ncbi:complement C1q-like protein 2 [Engraulis encrasicolus]|uniref:complement C1q-like protein 2 n=1 Tax=Engraulis encrasicolus TaxID=184585 RepID=UPI002FD6D295